MTEVNLKREWNPSRKTWFPRKGGGEASDRQLQKVTPHEG